MQLEHQFTVPAPPDVVWAAVVDPARVAPCMPGATLTEVNGSEFTGSVKVKLGPVSLLYKGSGQFVEIDEQSRRVVIKASGKDSRGNGTASATVTVTLKADGANTHGTVATDLAITGKPAQFGRGMISEVGGKILDTFANCLAGKLGVEAPAEQKTGEQSAEEPKPKPAPRRRTRTAAAAKPAAKPAAAKVAAVKPEAVKVEAAKVEAVKVEAKAEPKPEQKAESQPEPQPEPMPAPPKLRVVTEPDVEPIDLLRHAGPSAAKRVIPLVAGVLVLFLLIRWLRRR